MGKSEFERRRREEDKFRRSERRSNREADKFARDMGFSRPKPAKKSKNSGCAVVGGAFLLGMGASIEYWAPFFS